MEEIADCWGCAPRMEDLARLSVDDWSRFMSMDSLSLSSEDARTPCDLLVARTTMIKVVWRIVDYCQHFTPQELNLEMRGCSG